MPKNRKTPVETSRAARHPDGKGAGQRVVEAAGVPTGDGSDWALVRDLPAFVQAIGRHRNWDRATDPPGV